MKSLRELGEFGFINEVRRWARSGQKGLIGIGDDSAVLPAGGNDLICFTTDTIVENVHFTPQTPPRKVGWKAMAVNISDIAAMGGEPKYAVMSLTVPKRILFSYLKELYRGTLGCGRRFNVALVGGDTVKGREFSVTLSLIGFVKKRELTLRRGARAGDDIFVTGSLGGSISGKHLGFTPRMAESRFLAKRFQPNSMIDVSDGLIQDLGHILEESHAGAEIWLDKIPISAEARRRSKGLREAALSSACHDGEDFELLFTISPRLSKKLEKAWAAKFRTRLTKIGKIIKGQRKIRYMDRGLLIKEPIWLRKKGFAHF